MQQQLRRSSGSWGSRYCILSLSLSLSLLHKARYAHIAEPGLTALIRQKASALFRLIREQGGRSWISVPVSKWPTCQLSMVSTDGVVVSGLLFCATTFLPPPPLPCLAPFLTSSPLDKCLLALAFLDFSLLLFLSLLPFQRMAALVILTGCLSSPDLLSLSPATLTSLLPGLSSLLLSHQIH